MPKRPPPSWPKRLHRVLDSVGIEQVAYVPDAGHAQLIELCAASPRMRCVVLTTEEEGIALLCGAWLGGSRGVLLMQSSGVGNCINLLAMANECRFPVLMLVTMRGEWGEFNPWQVPMGSSTAKVLDDIGVIVRREDDAQSLGDTVFACAALAFNSCRPVAVLIGQRVIGFKRWD